MLRGVLITAVAIAVLSPAASALAAPGDLDPGFGTDGVVADVLTAHAPGAAVLQGDGALVTLGASDDGDLTAVRFTATGLLDPGFGDGGHASVPLAAGAVTPQAIALQSGGRILLAGSVASGDTGAIARQGGAVVLARLLPDGSLDPAFGAGGIVVLPLGPSQARLTVQGDDRIVVATSDGVFGGDLTVTRLTADGAPDPSFAGDGSAAVATSTASPIVGGVAVDGAGRVVVSATDGLGDALVARLTGTGVADPGFGAAGTVSVPAGATADARVGLAVHGDGAVVLAVPATDQRLTVVSLTSSGERDAGFGQNGVAASGPGGGTARAVAMLATGDLAVAGDRAGDLAVTRLTPTGAADGSFAGGNPRTVDLGGAGDTASTLLVQPDGRLVAAGAGGADLQDHPVLVRVLSTDPPSAPPPPPPTDTTPPADQGTPPPPGATTVSPTRVGGFTGQVIIRPPGATGYHPLGPGDQLPSGTYVDAREGAVRIATFQTDGTPGQMVVYGGLFQLLRDTGRTSLPVARLAGGNVARTCGKRGKSTSKSKARTRAHIAAFAARKKPPRRGKRVVRRLWSDGHGRFRVRGRYGSATVRGTKFLVADRCDGTLVRVRRGAVDVRDVRSPRHRVLVRAPHGRVVRAAKH